MSDRELAAWPPPARLELRDVLDPARPEADDPQLPPGLIPETFAARLYSMLAPVAQLDRSYGWSLLVLCNAIGQPFQLVEDIVRDGPDGPGWSMLLDVDRCPPEWLGWLAQLVGVRLRPDDTAEQDRERIRATDGFHRGTRQAIIAAAKGTLTGKRNVFIWERARNPAGPATWGAYWLAINTYASETPNPAATHAAILSQKPGGIVLDYRCVTGQSYQQVKDRFATYADVRAAYATYEEMRDDQPDAPD